MVVLLVACADDRSPVERLLDYPPGSTLAPIQQQVPDVTQGSGALAP
jgi:hypothetical protein